MDVTVAQPEAPAPTESTTETTTDTQVQTNESDPFAVDESQFVSLSPEQRAALDPVLTKFKESAKSYAQKERDSESKKYTDHVKKSQALEKLVADPEFVKWYQGRQAPQQTAPKTVASAEEWAKAYEALSGGDPGPLEQLQAKLVMSVGGPAIQRNQQEIDRKSVV